MPTTSTSRRRLRAPQRRQVLLEAAGRAFAAEGYRGARVDAIARQAGVTVPVLYDHFGSKAELYAELVEAHFQSLRQIWFRHSSTGDPLASWLGPAVDEWFAHVEDHPFAGRMLFDEATGDPEAAAAHRRIQDASRTEVVGLLRHQALAVGVELGDDLGVELAWETVRAILQGLAVWWQDRPDVPRARVVEAAMNALWVGMGGVLAGHRWEG